MQLTTEFKQNVREELIARKENYGGSDAKFARSVGISASTYSRLKKGELDRVLSDNEFLRLGKEFNVTISSKKWQIAKTMVYINIADNLQFCKENSKSMILVDDCGIGKTVCAKHIIRGMKNTFYVDCSQSKTSQQFVRAIARAVGIDDRGKYAEVKSNLKYYLNLIEKPLIILDEAGDINYAAVLELKELWNGTDGNCGWYMMGADGLRAKINRGIDNKKVGFAELFSRFSDEYVQMTPVIEEEKLRYKKKLLTDVATANVSDPEKVKALVNKCLQKKRTLRYLDTLITLNNR